jgi:hypothetical protein
METLNVVNKCYYRALKHASVCIEQYPVKIVLINWDGIKGAKAQVQHAEALVFVGGEWQRIIFEDGKYYADGLYKNEHVTIREISLVEYVEWMKAKFKWK